MLEAINERKTSQAKLQLIKNRVNKLLKEKSMANFHINRVKTRHNFVSTMSNLKQSEQDRKQNYHKLMIDQIEEQRTKNQLNRRTSLMNIRRHQNKIFERKVNKRNVVQEESRMISEMRFHQSKIDMIQKLEKK